MEPIKQILINILSRETMRVEFPDLDMERLTETLKIKGFNMLMEIQSILADGTLSDFECIERLVCLFEREDIPCGDRHDFG